MIFIASMPYICGSPPPIKHHINHIPMAFIGTSTIATKDIIC